MKKNYVSILSITLAFAMLLMIVPVHAEPPYISDGSKTIHYGAEFKQPGLGGCGYGFVNFITGTDFAVDFWLTPSQYEQLVSIKTENPDTTIYDAFNRIVPEQVVVLPEYVLEILKTRFIVPKGIGNYPTFQHGILTSPDGQVTEEWIDPCRNVVPEYCVPEMYLHPDPGYPGFYFIQTDQDTGISKYNPEMEQHLSNLGLSTDYPADIGAKSYFLDDGSYVITLTGSSPQGEVLSWNFILGDERVWRNSATGERMDDDARFVLAAMHYVDPPSKFSGNLMTATAQARTGTSLPTVSSQSSGTLAKTLLSHAGTSKLSKVNISSIVKTKAGTTSTASTASLVSQATVSLSDETTECGNFDMVSLAASYRSGGTAIASKIYGSDVLAARGIGG
jgi:hypothetical protein